MRDPGQEVERKAPRKLVRATRPVVSQSIEVRNHERLELATLDPLLEYGGDLALFAIEHVEDRAQLVSLPIHLESEIAKNQRGDKEWEDRNSFFIHGQVLE